MQTSEEFTVPPASGATGEVTEAYARVWRRVGPLVRLCAMSVARNRNEREELIQEARVKLWEMGAARCDITDPADLRLTVGMLMNHMRREAARRKDDADFVVPPDLVKELSGLDGAKARDP